MSIVLLDKMVESSPLTAVRTRTPWPGSGAKQQRGCLSSGRTKTF